MNASGFKDYVTDAIKFWERWRLAYNLVLAAIVARVRGGRRLERRYPAM
jgi:hypothetical protein